MYVISSFCKCYVMYTLVTYTNPKKHVFWSTTLVSIFSKSKQNH